MPHTSECLVLVRGGGGGGGGGDVMCHVCWLLLLFVQAYNMLVAQIEQHSSVGRKMDCKVLDVRDVDVRTHTL